MQSKKPCSVLKQRFLYQKIETRLNKLSTLADRTDANLGSRITAFHDLLSEKLNYRIPLKFFTGLRLVNFPHNTDTIFLFTLKSNLNKLFE